MCRGGTHSHIQIDRGIIVIVGGLILKVNGIVVTGTIQGRTRKSTILRVERQTSREKRKGLEMSVSIGNSRMNRIELNASNTSESCNGINGVIGNSSERLRRKAFDSGQTQEGGRRAQGE